jgi:phage-related protein (TIGR01555 family)
MSIRSFFANIWNGPQTPAPAAEEPALMTGFSTHNVRPATVVAGELDTRLRAADPKPTAALAASAMDDNGELKTKWRGLRATVMGEMLFAWYAAQSFIGYQMCAILAQHWLIAKACWRPARDAVRKGYAVKLTGKPDDAEEIKAIYKASKKYRVNRHLQEFVGLGRTFGIRIALFKVESTDPQYYQNPFNIDGVLPGSFKGIVQVDPYWCAPELNNAAVSDPASLEFYEPTWWMINGVRYHRSHLCIFRTTQPADMLKPLYLYGGIPLPQQIMERVYAAERTANEAPQLVQSKRTLVWNTNIAKLFANQEEFEQHMANFIANRDNYGVKINNTGDQMQQFDTTLSDLDEVIMTQYQIVAAVAGMPATKLLETTPKGFNSTGDYEEASYHEELETVQENDLTPFMDQYHAIVLRSDIEPQFKLQPGALHASIDWEPLDSPTAKELAETNKAKADTDSALVAAGAIDGEDVRHRIRKERDSGYTGLEDRPLLTGDPLDDAIAALQGEDPLARATAALKGGPAAGGGSPLDRAIVALGGTAPGATADPLDAATRALTGGAPGLEAATAALRGA